MKAASLIHAVRVAVTGKTVSPGLFEVLALLGRTRVHARLAEARRLLFDLAFLISPYFFRRSTRCTAVAWLRQMDNLFPSEPAAQRPQGKLFS